MKFSLQSYSIRKLIDLRTKDALLLNPPYQRNPIWSRKAQKALITSILSNWPLPTIFLRRTKDEKFEVVDGQQRLRAIIDFHAGRLSDLEGNFLDQTSTTRPQLSDDFYNYKIPVSIIEEVEENEQIENFYALVNRTGLRLNKLELAKAEYYNTEFLSLLQELSDENSEFSRLGIFTKASKDRMNDLDFISELVAQLKFGVSDKKEKVDDLFDPDISSDESTKLRNSFISVISIFAALEKITPIRTSRLRQKNDFYTFFGIISDIHQHTKISTIEAAYKTLLTISHLIKPSQEDCDTLQSYATHCVTQSNSKASRLERKRIMTSLFFNADELPSKEQLDVLKYYEVGDEVIVKTPTGLLTIDHSDLVDPRQPELFKPSL